MRSRIGLFAASAALAASAAQAQPSISGTVSYPVADVRTTGGESTGAKCQPAYPAAALSARAEGVTRMKLDIGADGRVAAIAVVDSAGATPAHKLLDQAGVQALTGCAMFTPRLDADGKAFLYSVGLDLRWSLHGAPPRARPPKLQAMEAGCRPVYPPAALRAGAQGDTTLRLEIDATGRVKSAQVVRSAGDSPEHKLLDQAAAQALVHCPYTPGTDTDGKAIASMILVSYRWNLEP